MSFAQFCSPSKLQIYDVRRLVACMKPTFTSNGQLHYLTQKHCKSTFIRTCRKLSVQIQLTSTYKSQGSWSWRWTPSNHRPDTNTGARRVGCRMRCRIRPSLKRQPCFGICYYHVVTIISRVYNALWKITGFVCRFATGS